MKAVVFLIVFRMALHRLDGPGGVCVDDFQSLSPDGDSSSGSGQPEPYKPSGVFDDFDDDIPF